jgi:bleomycin hydrolase
VSSANALTPEHLQQFQASFAAKPTYRLARNAVTKQGIQEIALNHSTVAATRHTYSHLIHSNRATNQRASGRCWLFAGLNLFRVEAKKRLNVEDFEFSQNFQMFWDKLEKANYFLESILRTLDEPTDSRLLMHLLQMPIQDGGQWDMFANLVAKYGVVPREVMPETASSEKTHPMNAMITAKLREFAAELRRSAADGIDLDALRARKIEMLEVVYRMLCIHLGEPPAQFDWQWRDKDEKFHRDGTLTPLEFFKRYVDYPMDSLVCLIHCPTADKPFNRLYTIDFLGNVREGEIIRYLNVELPVFKQAAVDMIVDGQPVWFGCDVGKSFDGKLGILDMNIHDLALVYGTEFVADKADRIEYGQSVMTHAMVLTGVDLDVENRPTRWRVENSWGDEDGDKGFLTMTDRWFEEYNYEVLVDKRFVPTELLPLLEEAPVVLPPWDPMGALAAAE